MNSICLTQGFADGHYVLPPLPYSVADMEPLVSAETLLLHHDKHHAAYVAGANAAVEALRKINNETLSAEYIPSATQNLAFNLGGHILHTLYWHCMMPVPGCLPQGVLADALQRSFGSYEAFYRLFSGVAEKIQGSGWAVMGVDCMSNRLIICGILRHQDVLVPGFTPLLACDVWEHAYYLTWKNNRKGYIETFMRHINWNAVSHFYRKAINYENCI